jgi:PAS domain S-box-containing protein
MAWGEVRMRGEGLTLEIAVPISRPQGPVEGVLLLGSDPESSLFPAVETWPVARRTAESVVVRREGEEVLYLSRMSERDRGPFSERRPLRETGWATVQAVLGRETGEALDYRGRAVLFAGRAVEGSPWLVVAKIDDAEVIAPARERGAIAAAFGLLLMAGAAAGMVLWLRRRAAAAREERRRIERERDAFRLRFEGLAAFANEAVLLLGEDGRIADSNQCAADTYGYSPEELRGLNIRELRDPATLGEVERQMDRTAREGGSRFETRHRRKDGSTFPVEVTSRVVAVDGARYWQSLVRDITERKKAEERLQVIFEASPDPITLARLDDGALVAVNEGFCRLHGRTEAEVLGHSTAQLGILVDPEERRAIVEEVRRSGVVHRRDLRVYAADRSVRILSYSARLVRLEQVDHLLSLARDVTEERRNAAERERLAEELRRRDEQYRKVVQSAPVVQWAVDAQGIFTLSEGKGLAVLGLAPGEVVGRSIYDFYRDRPDLLRDVGRTLGGETFVSVIRMGPIAFDCHWGPIRDEAGSVVGATGVAFDISERLRAEEAYRASEGRLRQILETMDEGVWMVDAAGTTIYANRRMALFCGVEPGAMVGRPFRDFVPAANRKDVWRLREQAARARGEPREIGYRRADGTELHLMASASPVSDLDGGLVGWVAVFMDVTQHRRTEEQLRQAQKMEAVGRLASGIAHDFNNLLVIILSGCDFLLQRPDRDGEVRTEVEQIRAAGERAANLVSQLLTFSRKGRVNPVRHDLNAAVGRMEKLLRRTIGEDIALEVVQVADPWPVRIDPTHLDQVLMNLAVNARDAMPRGGWVRIETRNDARGPGPGGADDVPPGRWATLLVSDGGAGMAPEVRAHIFEPFFTTTESGRGTGLGLSTVFGIVEQAGGRIAVESEPGRGTSFRLHFPVAEDAPAAEAPTPSRGERVARGETVLVVEDDAEVRRSVVRMLEESGFRALAAADGHEALARAGEGTVDLVLSDVVMPGMLGSELAERIRALHPGLPVAFQSGYADSRSHRLPADALLLRKPFTRAALEEFVLGALRGAPGRRPGG